MIFRITLPSLYEFYLFLLISLYHTEIVEQRHNYLLLHRPLEQKEMDIIRVDHYIMFQIYNLLKQSGFFSY